MLHVIDFFSVDQEKIDPDLLAGSKIDPDLLAGSKK